jgi:ABC-type molybdate transport system ATPase subunit
MGPFALVTLALPGGDELKGSTTRLAVDELGLKVGDSVRALVKAVALDERGIHGLRTVAATDAR